MINVILHRFKSDENGTFGTLNMNGEKLCYTCELPWDDNKPDESCIPLGIYNCINYSSANHPNVWQVCNVPGRSGILIHNGNAENDSLGCILVGNSLGMVNDKPAVLNSVNTLAQLKQALPDIFSLTIT